MSKSYNWVFSARETTINNRTVSILVISSTALFNGYYKDNINVDQTNPAVCPTCVSQMHTSCAPHVPHQCLNYAHLCPNNAQLCPRVLHQCPTSTPPMAYLCPPVSSHTCGPLMPTYALPMPHIYPNCTQTMSHLFYIY